jgi:hypothetical protein
MFFPCFSTALCQLGTASAEKLDPCNESCNRKAFMGKLLQMMKIESGSQGTPAISYAAVCAWMFVISFDVVYGMGSG